MVVVSCQYVGGGGGGGGHDMVVVSCQCVWGMIWL